VVLLFFESGVTFRQANRSLWEQAQACCWAGVFHREGLFVRGGAFLVAGSPWTPCSSPKSRKAQKPDGNELATWENTLFDLPPISATVATTMTKITAGITAYSATSCAY
jgi:hypothetical protein